MDPNLNQHKKLGKRLLFDDQETSNLGFGLQQLPARAPPRVHLGDPPAYPEWEEHPYLPDGGPISHHFIVIGWFPGKRMEPEEVCMWCTDPEKFLSQLNHQINLLRGCRRFFSLKTVQEFGLYKVTSPHFFRSKANTPAYDELASYLENI